MTLDIREYVRKNSFQNIFHKPLVRFQKESLKKDSSNVKLVINYWNGGGCFLSRIRTNPELLNLLGELPDVFVYAESCVYTSITSPLSKYDLLIHAAKRKSCRRGLAVLFLQKHRYSISKDHTSKRFDILWLKFKNDFRDEVYCFFYAPGQHHPEKMRMELYDELRSGFERYSIDVKIFLLGDSNARLGAYS